MPNKKPTPERILYEAIPEIPVAAKEVLADILQAAADQMREDKDTIDTLQRRVAELEAENRRLDAIVTGQESARAIFLIEQRDRYREALEQIAAGETVCGMILSLRGSCRVAHDALYPPESSAKDIPEQLADLGVSEVDLIGGES